MLITQTSYRHPTNRYRYNATGDEIESEEKRISTIDFLICDSCFWVASYFKTVYPLAKCPACNKDALKSLPISLCRLYALTNNKVQPHYLSSLSSDFWVRR